MKQRIDMDVYCYLAIGAGHWGRGGTIEEATANWRKQGVKRGAKPSRITIVFGDDKAWIDSDGYIQVSKERKAQKATAWAHVVKFTKEDV